MEAYAVPNIEAKTIVNVGNLISPFCQTYTQWDKILRPLTLAYRSTLHEVRGFTSNLIMTGWGISLPSDVMMGSLGLDDKSSVPEYVTRLRTRLQTCFEVV